MILRIKVLYLYVLCIFGLHKSNEILFDIENDSKIILYSNNYLWNQIKVNVIYANLFKDLAFQSIKELNELFDLYRNAATFNEPKYILLISKLNHRFIFHFASLKELALIMVKFNKLKMFK